MELEIIGKYINNPFTRSFCQIILLMCGFSMFYGQLILNVFDFGDNVWNARIYTFIALALIGCGTAFMKKSYKSFLTTFLMTFGILFIGLIFIGGGLVMNDALGGTDLAGGNMWIGFNMDAWAGDLLAIAKIIPTFIGAGVLVFGIVMLFYSEDAGQYAQAILEMGVGIAFIIIWVQFGI